MQAKLLEKLILFKDWLVPSKNWQLRSVVALIAILPLALALIFQLSNVPATLIVATVWVLLAPKIRTRLLVSKKEAVLIGVVGVIMSLILTAILAPVFVLWSFIGLNIGPALALQSIFMIFRPQKPETKPSQSAHTPRAKRKKAGKRDRKRYA